MVTHYNDILAEINSHIEGKVYRQVENANDATINYRHYGIQTKSEPVRIISNIQQEKGRLEMLTGQIQPFFFVGQCFDIHFLKDDRI